MRRGLDAKLAGGEITHDLLRAATDRVHAHLAIDPLDTSAAHVRHAAEDLARFAGAEFERLRRVDLQKR